MATLIPLAVLVAMCAVAGMWVWSRGRHERCRARVERAVAVCFSSAEWRGRIAFSVRPHLVRGRPNVRLSVMASTEREVVEALVAVMQGLPRGVRVTLDGTVGDKSSHLVHLIAHGTALKDRWYGR